MGGEDRLGDAAVARDVGAWGEDREEGAVEAGDLPHRLRRLRAAGDILVVAVAIAVEEEALPLVRRGDAAMVGRDVRERRDAVLQREEPIDLRADFGPARFQIRD